MADTHETIADIIAEMDRVKVCADEEPCLRDYARRFKAALKREKAAIEADALAVGGIVEAARKRGDYAKLRDTLQKVAESAAEIMERVRHKDGLAFNTANYMAGIAKDALAVPPRNCDMGTAGQQDERLADRLDAAHKRELSKNASKNGTDFGQLGDCAKLREALLQVIRSMELESGHMCTEKKRLGMHGQTQEDLCKGCRARNDECWTMTLKRECEAALAAPPRNCDVYNNESCRMAYHLHGDGLMTMQAFADWLFAPATEKEGGDNADK